MSNNTIRVDWFEEFSKGESKWENISYDLVYEYFKSHPAKLKEEGYEAKDKEKREEYAEELARTKTDPMMNFAYELDYKPSDENIIRICLETNCTVLENLDENTFYLALTGGGMDLSQDICLAYYIANERIPLEFAKIVSTQDGLSVSHTEFKIIMKECIKTLEREEGICRDRVLRIKEALKEKVKA